MKKKVFIIFSIVLSILIIISLFLILNKNNKKESVERKIASTIIMDINPSIKLELDENDVVINATALNNDALVIVTDDIKEKDLKTAIDIISNKLIENEFVKEDVTVLLNVDGKVSSSSVKEIIFDNFKEKNKNAQIIETYITDESKKISEEYNISINKAAYIESILKEKTELKIDDLKDKSITEICNAKEEKTTTEVTTNAATTATKKTTTKVAVSVPSDPTDTSGIWCTFNKNKPRTSRFDYPADIGPSKAIEYAKSAINASSLGIKGTSLSRVDDKRSSYCLSYKFMGYNDDNKYYVTIDSVTGNVIEQKIVPMDKPKITEEEAKNIGVNKFGIDPSSCDFVQAYFDMNNGKLRYSFASRCSGTYYSLEIDAMTGAVSKERTWT